MLVAAMVIGLIMGVGEFFGGAAARVYGDGPWLVIAIIPIGAIAIAGGFFAALGRPGIAGVLLLSSAVCNFAVGLASAPDGAGLSLFVPTVSLTLAGALALARRWKRRDEG